MMKAKRTIRIVTLLILVISLFTLLAGCGGGASDSADTDNGAETSESGPTPTPDPADLFPEFLVLHPDAYDIEVTEASGTYVYQVPMMVKETTEYLLAEHEARGWEKLGNPTVMGHLATLTMQMEGKRLTVSMQDNELSESTRVQILLIEQ
jgi:hypothetical protein